MKQGRFIVFEGGEGVGKSTQIVRLSAYLTKKGHKVLVTKEPGGSPLGVSIRKLLFHSKETDSLTDLAEAFLFLADRAQHVSQVIQPALAQNKIVICDRYYFSSIVYQGNLRRLGENKIETLSKVAIQGCEPDWVILLDCPVEKSLARVSQRGRGNRNDLEKKSFHEKVRKGFLKLAKKNKRKWKVISANETPERVFEDILEQIRL